MDIWFQDSSKLNHDRNFGTGLMVFQVYFRAQREISQNTLPIKIIVASAGKFNWYLSWIKPAALHNSQRKKSPVKIRIQNNVFSETTRDETFYRTIVLKTTTSQVFRDPACGKITRMDELQGCLLKIINPGRRVSLTPLNNFHLTFAGKSVKCN